ncbi:MAG: hypothetical protein H0T73_15990 [Ardenticatenales bacterium]|nr:hypothetical protein [Ardenticatenales bacterium]
MLSFLALLLGGLAFLNLSPTGLSQGAQTLYMPLVHRACEVPPPSNHLALLAGSYLGGQGAERLTSVDVAADGSVLVGGAMPGYVPSGGAPGELLGGGDGIVLRLDATGQRVLSLTRMGSVVNDLEINQRGELAVCGDFGVALLDSQASRVVWSRAPGNGARCTIAEDGTVAVLVAGKGYTYDRAGTLLGQWPIGGNAQSDIAIDAASQTVIATGYSQKTINLQVAFLKAWSYTGASRWTSYDFSATAVQAENLGADTRGLRVAMGRDGQLYFAGRSDGSNAIYTRDPQAIDRALGSQEWVRTDRYNDPYNNSATITWYGRYHPGTGELEKGQFLLARLSTGRGNTIKPLAIMADETGRVYLVGDTTLSIENRDSRQVAGVTVGPYALGEGFLLIVQPDFRQRLIWTPLAGSEGAGGSPLTGVSTRNGVAALVGTLTNGTLITHNAVQPTSSTLPDGYVAVWPRSCN